MKRSAVILLAVVVMFAATTVSWSGTVDPVLADRLDDLKPGQTEKVVVRMAEQADIPSLNMQLRQERSTLAVRHQQVIELLQDTAWATQPGLVEYLVEGVTAGTVADFQTFWIDNSVAVEATAEEIKRIAARPDVGLVFPDFTIELIKPVEKNRPKPVEARQTDGTTLAIEPGIAAIKAPEAWALGYTGAGRLVSNLDTGVDGTHPALASRWRGNSHHESECWFDPVTSTTVPFDSGSHGTHTMGTICGYTLVDEIGVAKDAQWIAAGVIDRVDIPTTMTDAVAAFQWLVDPDGNPGTTDDVPDSIGNSWGISPIYHGSYITGPCDTTFWLAIDNCEAAGSAVIFSAGNEGSSGAASHRTPSDRADSPYNTFSVGSVDATNYSFPYPISGFSSLGPGCNNQIKPEVVAPGDDVRSSLPGGGYGSNSGTSMASPHVTGAVAVLRQVDPNLDVDTIKEILLSTAVDLGPAGEDNTFGMGIIDLEAAVIAASQGFGTVQGTVTDSSTSGAVPARIEELGSGRVVYANAVTGDYSMSVPGDETHTIEATYFGYVTESQAVYVAADSTVTLDFDLDPAATGTIQGTVTDSGGSPINGVEVTVLNTPLSSVFTNGSGFYTVDAPGGSSYDLQYSASGHSTVTINDLAVVEGSITTQDVTMPDWPRILIWEPDPSPISGAAIQTSLSATGWDSVLVTDLFQYSNPLTDYDAIFVLVGIFSTNYTFSSGSAEESALVAFLDAGGNLYMEGGDVWNYDTYPATLRGYFNLIDNGDGGADLSTVAGVTGTFSDGMSFSYTGENSYMDHLGATSPAYIFFTNPSDGYGHGVAHDAGTYHTIATSFEFGGLSDGSSPSTKLELMEAFIEFFGLALPPQDTVAADLNCLPASGVVPFDSHMYVQIDNLDSTRPATSVSARINVQFANGNSISNWKAGSLNVSAGDSYMNDWNQNLPASNWVVAGTGENVFTLEVTDVTPAPYNQPPYPPSGDTDANDCTVTAYAP